MLLIMYPKKFCISGLPGQDALVSRLAIANDTVILVRTLNALSIVRAHKI